MQKKCWMKISKLCSAIFILIIAGFNPFAVNSQPQNAEILYQIGHSAEVTGIEFTPDEKYFVTCSRDHTVKIWNTITGKVFTIQDNEDIIEGISLSTDGKMLAYYSGKKLKLVDFISKKSLYEFDYSEQRISNAKFISANKILISTFGDFIILNTSTLQEEKKYPHPYSGDRVLAIHPNNNEVAAVEGDYHVIVYTLPHFSRKSHFSIDPEKVKELNPSGHDIYDVKYSPDGSQIGCITTSGQLAIFDTQKEKVKIYQEDHNFIGKLTYSNNSKYIFYASKQTVVKKDPFSGKTLAENSNHLSSISAMAFSPKNDYLATTYAGDTRGANDYSVKFWSGTSDKLIRSYNLSGYKSDKLAFLKNSQRFIMLREDESFFEFDLALLKLSEINNPYKTQTECASICKETGTIAIANFDGNIKLLNNPAYSMSMELSSLNGHFIYDLVYLPKKKQIAAVSTIGFDGGYFLSLIDVDNNTKIKSINFEDYTSLAVSNNNEAIAIASKDNIDIFDTQLNKTLNIPCEGKEPSELKFTENDKYLACGFLKGDDMAALFNINLGIQKISVSAKQVRDRRFVYTTKKSFALPFYEKKELVTAGNYNDFSIQKHSTLTGVLQTKFIGHQSEIESISVSADQKYIVSTAYDGIIKIWNYETGKELASLATFGHEGFVVYTPDKYYRASKDAAASIAFNLNGNILPFEQFDLVYNRPDLVVNHIAATDSLTQVAYYNAYKKRVEKMGFKSLVPGKKVNIPELSVLGIDNLEMATPEKKLSFTVVVNDAAYPVNMINIWVNGVPVYGVKGYSVEGQTHSFEKNFEIELSQGLNKISISAHNSEGFESLKNTFEITSTSPADDPKLYLLTIGVSEYTNPDFNLTYAAKDAGDVSTLFSEGSPYRKNIVPITITNNKALKENILVLKQQLLNTRVNDMVIVFIAGHGLLDKNMDYFIATHNVDFNNPQINGLPYAEIENLLDAIPARNKLMFIDACHSGEVDKNSSVLANASLATNVLARGFKTTKTSETQVGIDNSFELMQELFADLRKGTGAVVISAAGGAEFAFESAEWHNGVFTYALLEGLKTGNADADRNGEIVVSELRDYVFDRVKKLTNGQQNPTSRRENLEFDFRVW